jgi:hypothetical protein
MTPETIRSALQTKPFRPFVLFTRGGWEYPVNHPDLARISGTTLTIMDAGPDNTTSWVADIDIPSVTSLKLSAPTREMP